MEAAAIVPELVKAVVKAALAADARQPQRIVLRKIAVQHRLIYAVQPGPALGKRHRREINIL